MSDQPRVLNRRVNVVPDDAVYVGRPSKWGNPYVVGRDGSRDEVIAAYEEWLSIQADLDPAELRGLDLVCWCAPLPCHADVLLRWANG